VGQWSVPDVVEVLQAGLGPGEAILEGAVVAADPGLRGTALVPGGDVPAGRGSGESLRLVGAILLA